MLVLFLHFYSSIKNAFTLAHSQNSNGCVLRYFVVQSYQGALVLFFLLSAFSLFADIPLIQVVL